MINDIILVTLILGIGPLLPLPLAYYFYITLHGFQKVIIMSAQVYFELISNLNLLDTL